MPTSILNTFIPGTGSYTSTGYAASPLIDNGPHDMPYGPNGEDFGTNIYGSAGVLGATTSQPAPDPYAAWGGKAAYDGQVANFNAQKSGIYSTADAAAANAATGYKRSIEDFFDQAKMDQTALDQRGINNEMTKTAKMGGIMSMVGRGIRSGGVTLANKNAGSSSAAEAIARAYGDIGRREGVTVNNAYGLENNNILTDQNNLNSRIARQEERFGEDKNTMVNNIVSAAEQELYKLDAAMANASMPERIAIEQEKQNVRNKALAALQQHDALIAQSKPTAMSTDGRREEAARLAALGQGDLPEFNYTADVPMGFQGTGPFASELPIFTYKSKKNQA